MSEFCGWIGHASGAPAEILEGMTGRACEGLRAAGPRAALALIATDKSGFHAEDGQLVAAIDGYPRWTDPALTNLAQNKGHAAALLSAYRQFGTALFEKLTGAFSLAVLDSERGAGLLAIDRMGVNPLCYSTPTPDLLVFGSTTDQVRAHPDVGATIRPQAIYDFFYFIDRVPAPETIYREQMKLPPGHYLQLVDGTVQVKSYWQMSYSPQTRNDDELAAELLERLRAAVATCLDGADPDSVGAFLSGGLDSSTVLGLLTEQVPHAKSFTIGFDVQGFDETPYAKLAAEKFQSRHDIYYLQPDDVVTAISQIATIYDEPFANSSAVPTYFCALRAKQSGTEVMLAGDGGDELFAGNSRYLTDAIFDRYRSIPAPLRQGLIEPMARAAPWINRLPYIRKAPNYIAHAARSVPDRMFGNNLYRAIDPDQIFHRDVLAEICCEAPLALACAIYDEAPSNVKLHRMMYLDLRITLADGDIRKVNRMCELAGLRVRYPMLDHDLVAFSATIPPALLVHDGLRGFYKKAVADLLPREILTKEKKGFGLPYGALLTRHRPLIELACDSLQALKIRALFRSTFLDELTDNLSRGELGKSGGVPWDLIILEKWLETRMPS